MLKAAVIDDIQACRVEIKNYFFEYLRQNYAQKELRVDEFASGVDFLAGFAPYSYDLIFLDYYMDGLDGLTVAERIREQDEEVPLIFMTTSPDHAVDSYRVRASGYLLKPFGYQDFERTLTLARIDKIMEGQYLEISGEKVLLYEIVYCDRDKHYVQVHTARRGILKFRMAFEEINAMLAEYSWFLSCYRGCVVNMKWIKEMRETEFITDQGERVPFSVKNRKEIEKQYFQFLFSQAREGLRTL